MTAAHFSVTVVYAAREVEVLVVVTLPAGATVDDAIERSGIVARLNLDGAQIEPAVFGQRVNGHTPLAPGDRIELTRPLIADPKRARRKRAGNRRRSKQGSSHL
jgi:putative ubiquitin-RnfH superfamily antitoxin RatB of RatAB toxin-antitoxin module